MLKEAPYWGLFFSKVSAASIYFLEKRIMIFIIKNREAEIPSDLDAYIRKRIGKLEKFLEDVDSSLIEATVEIGKLSGRHRQGEIYRVSVNLKLPRKSFHWESSAENLPAAIDSAQEELEAEIKKFKTKKETLLKRGSRSLKKSLRLSPLARFRKK